MVGISPDALVRRPPAPDAGQKVGDPALPIFGHDSAQPVSPFKTPAEEQAALARLQAEDRLKARFEPSQPIGQDGPVLEKKPQKRGEAGYDDYQRYQKLKQEEVELLGLQMQFSGAEPKPILAGRPELGTKKGREMRPDEARGYLRYQNLKTKRANEEWLRTKYTAQPLPLEPPTLPRR